MHSWCRTDKMMRDIFILVSEDEDDQECFTSGTISFDDWTVHLHDQENLALHKDLNIQKGKNKR